MAHRWTAFLPLPVLMLGAFVCGAPALAQVSSLSVSTWITSASDLVGPEGVAADAAGNVYVSTLDNTIRKVTPQGAITLLAGSPSQFGGFSDGAGARAQFAAPRGLAVDALGNVYVADSGNYAVRKISPAGIVTTLAGASAQFANPTGVAVDASGEVFVADDNSSTVRKIAPDGTVSIVAGYPYVTGSADGAGPNARFNGPVGLAIDAAGDLYVADSGNRAIRKIDPAGNVTTVATGIPSPVALALAGNAGLIVADENDSVLRGVGFDGSVSVIAGTVGSRGDVDGAGATARLTVPCGVALLPSGNVVIADWEIDALRLGTPTPGSAPQASGSPSATADARLVNISARAYVGGATDAVTGFAISGTAPKTILVRGVGPTLAAFGVANALSQPELTLFGSNSSVLATQGPWNGDATVASTAQAVGAFVLPDQSADAAFVRSLSPGAFTVQMGSASGSGVALIELYDADSAGAPSRLVNVSTRAFVGTGPNALVAGFAVSGTGTETVLIRGIGPTLGQFGVSGALAATQLTVYAANQQAIAANSGWSAGGAGPTLASTFSAVGAFALPNNSADSALVLSLPSGTYTAQLSGPNGETGVGLIELYEVPH
jgi:hypothetical protein